MQTVIRPSSASLKPHNYVGTPLLAPAAVLAAAAADSRQSDDCDRHRRLFLTSRETGGAACMKAVGAVGRGGRRGVM